MFKVIAARKESLTSVSAHSVNLTECPLVSFRIFWAIMSPPQNVNNDLHPEKLSWNLKITQLIRKIIFQTVIFGFHVNFRGCSYSGEKVYHPLRHRRSMMFLVSRWYPQANGMVQGAPVGGVGCLGSAEKPRSVGIFTSSLSTVRLPSTLSLSPAHMFLTHFVQIHIFMRNKFFWRVLAAYWQLVGISSLHLKDIL